MRNPTSISALLPLLALPLFACHVCGDGKVNARNGEVCDDANNADADGCSADCALQSQVTSGDVNGVNANGAIFAIFGEFVSAPLDLDNDGAADDGFRSLTVVISDQPNQCDLFAPGQVASNDHLAEAFLEVKQLNIDTQEFQAGDSFVGLGQNNVDVSVDVSMQVIENDALLALTVGPDPLFPSDGLGTFNIQVFEPGVALTANFSGKLDFDSANQAAFDTDLDNDGVLDAENIDVDMSGVAINATFCPNL